MEREMREIRVREELGRWERQKEGGERWRVKS